MKLQFALLGLAGASAVAAAACSAMTNTLTTGSGGSQGGTGPGASAGGHDLGVGGISFPTGSGMSTGSGCQTHCSSDLHSLVDCNGTVLSTCPADQGCSTTGCVSACESAKENKSTIGCDYYSVDPDSLVIAHGSCFAAFVANTWTAPVTISVERAGQLLDAAGFSYLPSGTGQALTYTPLPGGQLPPGQVAIVFLAQYGGQLAPCPAGVNVGYTTSDAAVYGTAIGDAFHLTTSAPVVAYDIFPYGGGQSAVTSATLLLPTTAWDTNYIAVDAFRKSTNVTEAQPSIDIVAAEDGTEVTISPTAAIVGGPGVAATGKGQPRVYHLDKGQILQLTQNAELVGSPIQANKPVGLWGAASCLSVDVNKFACDSAHQQIPPVKALGHEYVAVRYRNRFDGQEESPPWRLVGAVDGTTLTWDPALPPSAPTTLASGQVAEFRAPGPFTVKSQDANHPFYMASYMTGCQEVNPSPSDCRGDPEFVNVIPPQQYLASYVFFTDPTYPETNLVLVRTKGNGGFKDVALDCGGKLGDWQPVGTSGEYEYTRFDLARHDFAPQGGCDNGRHEIHSDGTFGLVVWGWGSAETGGSFGSSLGGFYSQAVSYGYPAGASLQPINTVVVPAILK